MMRPLTSAVLASLCAATFAPQGEPPSGLANVEVKGNSLLVNTRAKLDLGALTVLINNYIGSRPVDCLDPGDLINF